MKYSRQLRSYGYIKPAVKQGDKETGKNVAEIEKRNHIKEICLNCTEPRCHSKCKAFKKESEL
jgi:hypothetical protein